MAFFYQASHSNKHPDDPQSIPCSDQLKSNPQQNQQISNSNHHCVTTFNGHTSYISSLTISGKFLCTGSSDGEIRSWKRIPLTSSESFDHENSFTNNNNMVATGKGAVKFLVISADTNKLFSAHQDHKIRVWKIITNNNDDVKYSHLATLPTLGDRTLKILMPKNQVQIRRHKTCTWVHHVDTVSSLALSSDNSLLYSVSWDRTIKIWKTGDFKCLESITNAHEDAINAVVVSSTDGKIYTGSADKRIKVWKKHPEEKKHNLLLTLEKHDSGINALALSSDGSVLYSAGSDRLILVWENEEGEMAMKVMGVLRGHKKPVLCLAVVDDLVCSGSADTSVRIWRRIGRDFCCLRVLEGHNGAVKCLNAVTDYCNNNQSDEFCSYLVYSGGLDCSVKAWQISVPRL